MTKKKLLVVEDDAYLLNAYVAKLEHAGYEVYPARSGDEALFTMGKERPDLVLLDLVMPGKNGFDVLTSVALNPHFANAPIVVLSNLSSDADIKRAMELGATEYLVKSNVSMESIAERVAFHLKVK